MSTIKVDGIRSNGDTSGNDAITLADNTTCTANITNRQNRNLIINGAMQVAERGTSFTASGSYPVDRFRTYWGGSDENPTVAQVDVASGTTPYTLGFRKSLKITNGDQTGGAGTSDYLFVRYKVEAQDLAESGWNYTSASSYITLSFWVKSSVSQTFQCRLETQDGTKQNYPFETGSLTADTWTKITKTIPGNSNITVNNDTGTGLEIWWELFRGTSETDNSLTNNAWAAENSSQRTKDQTTTWWTTDEATFEMTGVQFEVSDYATSFEHRSYAQELQLCKRYYQKWSEGNSKYVGMGSVTGATEVLCVLSLPVPMRGTVAIDHTNGNDYWRIAGGNLGGDKYIDAAWTVDNQAPSTFAIYAAPEASLNSYLGESGYVQGKNASSYMAFESEL